IIEHEDGEVKTLISRDVTSKESKLYNNTIKSDPKHTECAISTESMELEVELSDVEANSNDLNKEKQLRETKAPQNQQRQSRDQLKTEEKYTENYRVARNTEEANKTTTKVWFQ
ncbi:hypothetical protein TorRG33x02_300880, partial [Trema orientale]